MILAFYARAGEMRVGFSFENVNLYGSGSKGPRSRDFSNWDGGSAQPTSTLAFDNEAL